MITINLLIIIIISHLTIAGSLIGGIPETQVSKIILPHCHDYCLGNVHQVELIIKNKSRPFNY